MTERERANQLQMNVQRSILSLFASSTMAGSASMANPLLVRQLLAHRLLAVSVRTCNIHRIDAAAAHWLAQAYDGSSHDASAQAQQQPQQLSANRQSRTLASLSADQRGMDSVNTNSNEQVSKSDDSQQNQSQQESTSLEISAETAGADEQQTNACASSSTTDVNETKSQPNRKRSSSSSGPTVLPKRSKIGDSYTTVYCDTHVPTANFCTESVCNTIVVLD